MSTQLRQFTMRGVIWAMFWAALMCAAWKAGVRATDGGEFQPMARICMFILACGTVGALYGRAAFGAIVGSLCVLVVGVLAYMGMGVVNACLSVFLWVISTALFWSTR